MRIPPMLLALTLAACARMGSPDGGWYDDSPPKVVSSSPKDRSLDVKSKKISIVFDEYIKLDDAQSNVVISPPQIEQPEIKTAGKKIVIALRDSLIPSTTYTVDFSDAISDNNEGNPMGNYTYSFSTGQRIDTFELSGYVLNAEDLEPVKGILAGVYSDLSDTAFTTKPFQRVGRTDASGHFVIKGVAPGEYRAYALMDADGNYLFNQKSEQIAFSPDIYTPSAKADTRQDTVWRDSLHIDSIRRTAYTHFLPDDITLLAFTEASTDRYLLKAERKTPEMFSLSFTYPSDSLPRIEGLNFNSAGAFLLETSVTGDTLSYWIRDTALVEQDTLEMAVTYLMTDSAGQLTKERDTMEVITKTPKEKRMKEREKELEEWEKECEKKKKDGEPYDSIMPPKALEVNFSSSATFPPNRNVLIETKTPLERFDSAGVHLYIKIDTLWYRAPFVLERAESSARRYTLKAEWQPGADYSLEIDSAALIDIYSLASKAVKKGLKIQTDEEFSSLFVDISGIDEKGTPILQLLDNSGNVKMEAAAKDGRAEFYYVAPGEYYMRCFVDKNGNGRWDSGLYSAGRQGEPVFYYREKIECKAKWDVSRSWDVSSVAIIKQKPAAITKQKGEAAKQLKNRNAERALQLGIKEPGK